MKFGFPARAAPLRSYNILSFSFRMPQRPFSIALKSMMEALHSNLLKQCPADKRFSENLQKLYLPQNQPSAGRALFASSLPLPSNAVQQIFGNRDIQMGHLHYNLVNLQAKR